MTPKDFLYISGRIPFFRSLPLPHPPSIAEVSAAEVSAKTSYVDEVKHRIAALGYTQQTFAEYLEMHKTTFSRWWQVGSPPTHVMRIIELLENQRVASSWRETKSRAAPTADDARKAIYGPISSTIDTAISQGWNRQQIAEALRMIADETDGSVRS